MPLDPGVALATAARIADHLCRTAFVHNGRCTWCGMVQDSTDDSETLSYQTLSSDLYDGTSGVALFLGEAYVRVGDPRFRATAEAGIWRALDRVESVPRECRLGCYTGAVGIAYAGARLGHLIDRGDFIERSRAILGGIMEEFERPSLTDIISGTAGAIPLLLALAENLALPDLRLLALKLGEATIADASKDPDGWSWGSGPDGIDARRNLTGFAHGAAGIGWSLLELYKGSGESRFLDAALEAFRYEDHWFQPAEDNWPDFRWDIEAAESPPCMVAWCHGAPGIGLARLAALQVRDIAWIRRDAEAAVRASTRALANPDRSPDDNFCLCHGRGGIAEFLLRAGNVLGDQDARDLALATAAEGALLFGSAPESWPVGLSRGSTPSLMTGLAGIGYFYLGLSDPKLPSMLLPASCLDLEPLQACSRFGDERL
jgi:lantibiotic modifying enzyme